MLFYICCIYSPRFHSLARIIWKQQIVRAAVNLCNHSIGCRTTFSQSTQRHRPLLDPRLLASLALFTDTVATIGGREMQLNQFRLGFGLSACMK